jgi:hypothetical protein
MPKFPVAQDAIRTVAINGPLKGMQVRSRHNYFKAMVPVRDETVVPMGEMRLPEWKEEVVLYQLHQVWEDRLDVDILPHVRETIREQAFKTQDGCYYYWAIDLTVAR